MGSSQYLHLRGPGVERGAKAVEHTSKASSLQATNHTHMNVEEADGWSDVPSDDSAESHKDGSGASTDESQGICNWIGSTVRDTAGWMWRGPGKTAVALTTLAAVTGMATGLIDQSDPTRGVLGRDFQTWIDDINGSTAAATEGLGAIEGATEAATESAAATAAQWTGTQISLGKLLGTIDPVSPEKAVWLVEAAVTKCIKTPPDLRTFYQKEVCDMAEPLGYDPWWDFVAYPRVETEYTGP